MHGVQKKQNVFHFVRSQLPLSLITGGMIIVVGILISDIPRMVVSRGWPTTDGTILYHRFVGRKSAEYNGNHDTNIDVYIIDVYIRYQYSVNGITYTSLSLNSIDTPFYPSSYASQYPVGKDVIVYYNPKNPSDAVLEPGFVDIDAFSYCL